MGDEIRTAPEKISEREMRILITGALLTAALSVGGKLLYPTVSFDMEIMLNKPDALYSSWLGFGRWALVVFKYLTNMWYMNPAMEAVLLFVNTALAAFAWSALILLYAPERRPLAAVSFSVLFLTHPIFGEQYIYMLQAAGVSFALFLGAISLYLMTEGLLKKSPLHAALALVPAAFCMGTYQTFMMLLSGGAAGIYLLLLSDKRTKIRHPWKMAFLYVGWFAVSYVINAVSSRICCALYGDVYTGDYLSGQFRWGKDDISTCLASIRGGLSTVLRCRDSYFNPLFPVLIFAGLLVTALLIRKLRYPLHAFIAVLYLSVCPFLLLLLTATEPQLRTQFTVPFAAAFLAVYVLMLVPVSAVKAALLVLFAVCSIRQASLTEKVAYTESVRYYQDLSVCETLVSRIRELGVAAPGETPLVILGIYRPYLGASAEEHHKNGAVGFSLFEVEAISPNKVNCFLRDHGYVYAFCEGEDIKAARAVAENENLPAFPAKGCVVVRDGRIIVQF